MSNKKSQYDGEKYINFRDVTPSSSVHTDEREVAFFRMVKLESALPVNTHNIKVENVFILEKLLLYHQ